MNVMTQEVEINEIDNKDETALMKAVENGQEEIVDLLLKHPRIAINLKDLQGKTALDKAKAKNHEKIVQKLRMAGAKE
jgi:ankyrin repeat protein